MHADASQATAQRQRELIGEIVVLRVVLGYESDRCDHLVVTELVHLGRGKGSR